MSFITPFLGSRYASEVHPEQADLSKATHNTDVTDGSVPAMAYSIRAGAAESPGISCNTVVGCNASGDSLLALTVSKPIQASCWEGGPRSRRERSAEIRYNANVCVKQAGWLRRPAEKMFAVGSAANRNGDRRNAMPVHWGYMGQCCGGDTTSGPSDDLDRRYSSFIAQRCLPSRRQQAGRSDSESADAARTKGTAQNAPISASIRMEIQRCTLGKEYTQPLNGSKRRSRWRLELKFINVRYPP